MTGLADRPWSAWIGGPARRGGRLARRAVREFADDHCEQLAAAMSYHVLFSLFPLAIAGIALLGVFSDSAQVRDNVVDAVLRAVPLSGAGQDQLRRSLVSVSGGSGALGFVGVIGVLYAASGVMSAVRTAVNVAWDVEHRRPFLRGKLVDLMLLAGTFVAICVIVLATMVTALIRRGAAALPSSLGVLAPLTGAAAAAATLLAAAALLFLTFLTLYRVLPAVPVRCRDIWPGALTATVGFEAVQYGFAVYVSHFAHYNKVYGALGAVVAFLFFVYLASAVFLLGAEVASEYPRLRAEARG